MKLNRNRLPLMSTLCVGVFAYLIQACTPPAKEAEDNVVWPGESWAVSTPAEEGAEASVLDSIHNDILSGKYGLIDEFLVIKNGKVIADHSYNQKYDSIAAHYDTTNHMFNYDHPEWHPYYKRSKLHSLQSVTKSITSAALGIAIDEGYLTGMGIKPMEMFADFEVDMSDSRRVAMTLEDMLTMRSGIDWNEMTSYNDEENSCIIMEGSDNWVQYVLSRPMREEPGTVWDYNSGVSVLLGKLVSMSTGQRVDHWTAEKLFKPIGIQNYFWKTTPDNEVDTEGGLYLSSHDLARVGYLFLRNGKWGDQQIISESYVQRSVSPVVPDITPDSDQRNSGYGFQWWVPFSEPKIFAGNGYGGQFLMVAPQYDLIVVFNGWDIHDNERELQSWSAITDRIIPSLNRN